MAMTDEQIERYSRHIILKEVGAKQAERKHEGSFHYTDPDKVPDDTQWEIIYPCTACLSKDHI